jgi:NRPS condensation-like uncharacterized protein
LNLYKNLKLLNTAIYYWIQRHPLLRCKIEKVNEIDKYFVKIPIEELNIFESIDLLVYESYNNQMNNADLALFSDYEVDIPIDSSRGPLWRLKIIKLSSDNTYLIMLNIHHGITDGRNMFFLILELCDLIQKSYLGKLCENDMKEYNEEINFQKDPRGSNSDNQVDINQSIGYKIPEYFRPTQTCSSEPSRVWNGYYRRLQSNEIIRLDDIYHSKRVTDSLKLVIQQDLFKKLLGNCKKHQVKLSSCIALVSIVSYTQLQRKYSRNCSLNDQIKCAMPASLKSYLKPELNNHIAGLWMSRMSFTYRHYANQLFNREYYSHIFWKEAKTLSDTMHERLAKMEHFSILNSTLSLHKSILNGLKIEDNCMNTLSISNLGHLSNCLNNSDNFRVIDFYASYTFKKPIQTAYLFNLNLTVDNKLYWLVAYSREKMKDEVASDYIKIVEDTIKKLTID